jgi:hypothetical protein
MFDTLKLMAAIARESLTHPLHNSVIQLTDGKAVVTQRSREPIMLPQAKR